MRERLSRLRPHRGLRSRAGPSDKNTARGCWPVSPRRSRHGSSGYRLVTARSAPAGRLGARGYWRAMRFMEIFQPGLKHLREEQYRHQMDVAYPTNGGNTPIEHRSGRRHRDHRDPGAGCRVRRCPSRRPGPHRAGPNDPGRTTGPNDPDPNDPVRSSRSDPPIYRSRGPRRRGDRGEPRGRRHEPGPPRSFAGIRSPAGTPLARSILTSSEPACAVALTCWGRPGVCAGSSRWR